MSINAFYKSWGMGRAIAFASIILFMLIMTIKSYCYTVEMDYTGPGSEAERLDRSYNDRENERAFERVQNEGSTASSDVERAEAYVKDHSA